MYLKKTRLCIYPIAVKSLCTSYHILEHTYIIYLYAHSITVCILPLYGTSLYPLYICHAYTQPNMPVDHTVTHTTCMQWNCPFPSSIPCLYHTVSILSHREQFCNINDTFKSPWDPSKRTHFNGYFDEDRELSSSKYPLKWGSVGSQWLTKASLFFSLKADFKSREEATCSS